MIFEISKTDEFEMDVDEALEYIMVALKAPQAALTLLNELERAFDDLKETPYLSAVSRKPILRMHECRERFVKAYVIVYKIESGVVYLLGFYHQKQLYDLRFLDRSAYEERMIHDELFEKLGLPLPRVSRFTFMTDDEIKLERHISKGRISVEEQWERDRLDREE